MRDCVIAVDEVQPHFFLTAQKETVLSVKEKRLYASPEAVQEFLLSCLKDFYSYYRLSRLAGTDLEAF